MKKYDYALLSGGFDPVHIGHLAMIKDASNIANEVIILLNSDNWLTRKKLLNIPVLVNFGVLNGPLLILQPGQKKASTGITMKAAGKT